MVSGKKLLAGVGSVSADSASTKAEKEFEIYCQKQEVLYVSDFDRDVKRLQGKNK